MTPKFPQATRQVREALALLAESSERLEDQPAPASEAMLAGAYLGMERSDWILPGVRERAGAVLRGCSMERLRDACRGAKPYRIAPPGLSPAFRMLQACGLAVSSGAPSLCFLGQAALSYGAFHEALNLAALQQLPVIFLMSERDLQGAPIGEQLAGDPLAHARAFGIQSKRINGLSAKTVFNAVQRARSSRSPTFLSARLYLPKSSG